jgi:hypothetical protein
MDYAGKKETPSKRKIYGGTSSVKDFKIIHKT